MKDATRNATAAFLNRRSIRESCESLFMMIISAPAKSIPFIFIVVCDARKVNLACCTESAHETGVFRAEFV